MKGRKKGEKNIKKTSEIMENNAKHPAPAQNHEDKYQFLSKLKSIPLLQVTFLFTANLYAKATESLWILGKASELFVSGYQQVTKLAQPFLDRLLPFVASPLSKADNLATKGLETLERTVPAITKQPQEIVSETKELISSRVTPAVERLSVVSENVLSSRAAQFSFDVYEKVLVRGNALANSVLPSSDQANGAANGFPRAPEPENKSDRGTWLVKESFFLLYTSAQRLFGIVQSRTDNVVNNVKKSL